MIPKITKGRSAYGALGYDHGPGRRDEHTNPHMVAGNVAGKSWRERAKVIDGHARDARPDVARPIHRTALRLSPQDRGLPEREWRQVAERYIERMGFQGCPWEATRHADDHIHVTVSRVRWDGTLATDSHDYAKAQTVCREIEARHHLTDASARYQRSKPEITRNERDSAERRGVVPEREQLRDKIRAAEQASEGTRQGYEAALTTAGVGFRANIASTGKVSGYSYTITGHRDSAGEAVFFKGSQLGKDYSWANTQKRIKAHWVDQTTAWVEQMRAAGVDEEAIEARLQSMRSTPRPVSDALRLPRPRPGLGNDDHESSPRLHSRDRGFER